MPTSPGACAADPSRSWPVPSPRCARMVDEIDPDVLVVFDTDHFHQWFYDRLPAFAVGVAVAHRRARHRRLAGRSPLRPHPGRRAACPARLRIGIAAAFDLTLSEEFQVDHSITVPVHFLAASDGVVVRPIVPVWINGIAPPFPLAPRCRDLGAMVSARSRPTRQTLRVGLVASGAISGDIGGAHSRPGQPLRAAGRGVARRRRPAGCATSGSTTSSQRLRPTVFVPQAT